MLAAVLGLAGPAYAADPPAAPRSPAAADEVPGWNAFVERLRALGPEMLARLPESWRADPQVRQEVGRLMLEALGARALEAVGGDGDHPQFMPAIGLTLNISQPNSDTIYRRATVTPGGVYRLSGRRGSVRIAKIGEYVRGSEQGIAGGVVIAGYHDLNALHVDGKGRFEVVLSAERPAGWTGDWWKLDPRTTSLGIRQVASDWAHDRDPEISIERLDIPAQRPRPSAADLRARLDALGPTTANAALNFVAHVAELRQQGYVNKLHVFDVAALGAALEGQFYYEGGYELRDDEALIVEAKVPARCLYYSTILTNEIYETTDWYNNESSLNDSQSRVDKDGVLRIVVSAKDPGVPNWLDTAGYPIGAIQGRWTGCSEQPVPSVRKVALADVRSQLPPDTPTVTPAQRDRIVRDRRALLQQRPLW